MFKISTMFLLKKLLFFDLFIFKHVSEYVSDISFFTFQGFYTIVS